MDFKRPQRILGTTSNSSFITIDEWEFIRSQIATASSNDKNMWSQNVTASQKKRNISATPYAFTEIIT